MGGSHANVAGLDAAKNIPSIDIVSYHPEGETVILQLIEDFSKLKHNRKLFLNDFSTLRKIKGIIFKYDSLYNKNLN